MNKWSNWVIAFFRENRGPKAVALFLAVLSWYGIQSLISYETTLSDVPLVIRLDHGWAILDRSANAVDVTFRGSQEDMRLLDPKQVKVVVDLRGVAKEGPQAVRLRPKYVLGGGAARVVSIKPEEVSLSLDRESEKMVPVKAEIQGNPPDGYDVDQIVCTPAAVTLVGPKQKLDEVDVLRTVPVDVEARTRTFKRLRVPVVPPSESWVARMSPESVAVEVVIVERSATRELADVRVAFLSDERRQEKITLEPDTVSLVLRGRAEVLQSLKPNDVQAYVDIRDVAAGKTYDLPIQIVSPPGITLADSVPKSVRVMVGGR